MRAFLFANENGQGVPPCVADVTPFASLKAGEMERMCCTLCSLAQKPLKHFFAYNFVILRATPP